MTALILATLMQFGAEEFVIDSYQIEGKPLRKVILEAGGLKATSDPFAIHVARGEKVYTVTWDHITALPDESMLVLPDDLVTVDPIPFLHTFLNVKPLYIWPK